MLFSVPLFDTATYITSSNSYELGLYIMAAYETGSKPFNDAYISYIEQEIKSNTPLIYVNAMNATWFDESTDVNNIQD